VCFTHHVTARVHHQRFRRQQRFDVFQQEKPVFAIRNQACRWRVQDAGCTFNLRGQSWDLRLPSRDLGPNKCSARGFRPNAPHCDPRNYEIVSSPQRGRKRRGVEIGQHTFGVIQVPEQEEAPHLEIARMRGVRPVAVLFERRARSLERPRRPAQLARGERDLAFGDDTPRASHGLFRAKGARRASHQSLRSNEIAELRHGDAAQSERRRIIAQCDSVQCAEGITCRQCACCCRDQ
jgi:hypothetical protein